MKLVTSLAVVIGGLGALATWLFLAPLAGLHLQIWAAFIAWASYFATGGTPADLPKSMLANLWGVAWATAALIGVGIFGHLGAPVIALIVGVTVCLMILGGHLPLLGAVPALVFGYAPTAAFGLLTSAAGTDIHLGTGPSTTIAASMIVGAAFAYVSGRLVGMLTK
jgi:hypothetical protein